MAIIFSYVSVDLPFSNGMFHGHCIAVRFISRYESAYATGANYGAYISSRQHVVPQPQPLVVIIDGNITYYDIQTAKKTIEQYGDG